MNFTVGFEEITNSTSLKVTYGIVFALAVIESTIFNLGFVYYEYYGGDPMKRSIKVRKKNNKFRIFKYLSS